MDALTRTFFGGQIPLFPEIEPPPVTPEEDEAFAHLEKKQVGGTHYLNAMQPWDIIKAWELNYWAGNVIKYTLRHPYKGRKEDLEKAKHYLEYMIENYDELYPVSD